MYDDIDLEDPSTWAIGLYTCTNKRCEGYDQEFELRVPEDPAVHRVICGQCGVEITKKART